MNFSDYGINIGKVRGGKTTCPKCSETRKNKKDPCLSVDIEKGLWNCHNCNWSGGLNNFSKTFIAKEYSRPAWVNHTGLSENLVKWFSKRGITQEVVMQMRITEGKIYMPQLQKETNTVQFNYFRDSELVNVKYRDGAKNFKLFKDAELIFYNLDSIKGEEIAVITEGEMDCLSLIEAGIKPVVSVPNGASKGSQKLEYLDNCWQYFEDKKAVILAVDADEAGLALRDELCRRIGIDKCHRINLKDCKDANEFLIKYGKLELEAVINNAEPFPLEGIFTAHDLQEDVYDLYRNGLKKADGVGIPDYDRLLTYDMGQMTVVTGIPNQGKSEFTDFVMVRLAVFKGWKFAMFSPENFPLKLHLAKLCEKIVGKSFSGIGRMNEAEIEAALRFIDNHFFFIRPKDENFTLTNIMDKTKSLILRYGINCMLIDPWNRLEHQVPNGKSETLYISEQLDKLTTFKQRYGIHIFVVAHPTKIKKDKVSGKYEVPNLYDITGSANFFNKFDNGFTIYRDFADGTTHWYVQKVKFKHLGEQGVEKSIWNSTNGRYTPLSETADNTNYLTAANQQSLTELLAEQRDENGGNPAF